MVKVVILIFVIVIVLFCVIYTLGELNSMMKPGKKGDD